MTDQTKPRKGVPIWALAVIVIVAAGITFAVTALIISVSDRKVDAGTTYTPVVELTNTTYDPSVWGQQFPQEYDGWLATKDFKPTTFQASLVQRDPSVDPRDPRTETTASKLEEDPRLKTMWNGYAFALDYRHLRGHAWMSEDQAYTLRVLDKPQPGACLNCHTSLPEVLDTIAAEQNTTDTMEAWASMNKMAYQDAEAYSKGPVGCIDCHDPQTMNLRVTRPALINGLRALKASQGIADYDVNTMATTQEMRAYVCAQCHVEYYFADGDNKVLTFPWAQGTDIDDVYQYYQDIQFFDFKHAQTGAEILKIQHPEFETWSSSVHAMNGVTCADCHMNYQRVGAQKFSNHDVASPMLDINGTCGTCHTASEEVIKNRVTTIQNRYLESRDRAMDALTAFIGDIDKAIQDGTTPQAQIDLALAYQRQANMYADWGYSENSYGFHNPDLMQRIFAESIDASRKGQLALRGVSADALTPSDLSQQHTQEISESGLK